VTGEDGHSGERAYLVLHAAINRGELSPNERLVEHALVARYGVSRGAVRTALVRLEQDGVVVRERNRGAHVRLVPESEALEILEARSVLEGLAASHAAARATDADIEVLRCVGEEMRRFEEHGDLLAMSERNARFHRMILELSGHETVRRLTEALNSHMVRFQYRTILVAGRAGQSLTEHRAIIDAIAARDAGAAEGAMRAHLSNVAQTLRARVQPGTDDAVADTVA
jgi:DNA-binding GntR family transcriptional regulator